MKQTLLIDLDDTLLPQSSADFFPAYLNALSNHLKFLAQPETILTVLFQATERMRANLDPAKTLKQVFDETFYPKFNTTYHEVKDEIDSFYTNIYPTLNPVTTPQTEVIDFIEKSLDEGFSLVIATDPYFPRQAVLERLRWAGVPPEKYPFELITSYENFHFTKPHIAYYAEVLAHLGWPESSYIMIGNDPDQDIKPAKKFGLVTYQSIGAHNPAHNNGAEPHGTGTLAEFHPWLKDNPDMKTTTSFSGRFTYLEIMRATPASLQPRLAALSPQDWHTKADPEEWNPTEILCHFRDVDRDIHIPRFKEVRDQPSPFLEAVDADGWAQARNYHQQDGPQAFQDFLKARKQLLDLINSLPSSISQKDIQHTIFGPITLDELVRIAARHDRLHIQQLFAQLQL